MSGLIKLTSRWQQVTHAKAIMGIPMMMMMIMKTMAMAMGMAMMLIMLYATIIISSMIITKAI